MRHTFHYQDTDKNCNSTIVYHGNHFASLLFVYEAETARDSSFHCVARAAQSSHMQSSYKKRFKFVGMGFTEIATKSQVAGDRS